MKIQFLSNLGNGSLKWYLMGFLGYFGLVALFYFFFLRPEITHYDEIIADQIKTEQTYVDLVELDVESAIDTVKKQIEELEAVKVSFENRLLTDRHFNSLMPIIDQYCAKSNLVVQKLDPIKQVDEIKPNYLKRSIKATLGGKYGDFMKFLDHLETNQEWLLIDQLKITPGQKQQDYTFSFLISILMEEPEKS